MLNNMFKVDKTAVQSFRSNKQLLEDLHKYAVTEKISLNALINQIFEYYLSWYAVATKADMVPHSKILLTKIFEKLKTSQIIEIAEYMAEQEIKSIILILRKEFTPESFLSVIESWAKVSNFPTSHTIKSDSSHQYILHHNMNKKWSLYYERVFGKIFEQLKIKYSIQTTKNALMINLLF